MTSSRAVLVGWVASLAVHLTLALVLLRLPSPESSEVTLEIVYDEARARDRGGAGGELSARASSVPVVPGGRRSADNIDADRAARGGDGRGSQDVIVLLPHADAITLQDSPMTALGAAQTNRILTARDRATREDRRATPNPEDDVFVASGRGMRRERRPVSTLDPRSGARLAPDAADRGPEGEVGRADSRPYPSSEMATAARELAETGAKKSSPGVGILHGQGQRESAAAPVATARPPVDRASATTTAIALDPHVRDNVDAELLAAKMVQSRVEATERTGEIAGSGVGGADELGRPGLGSTQRGRGRARPTGPGHGGYAALDTDDQRYAGWYLEQRRRVADALVFPYARELAMDQGTTVYRVVVRRDGTLGEPPRLLRSSGFPDMDRAALVAIQQAAPFTPLPDELAPEHAAVRVTLGIEFRNPMVR